jgi:RNA polymerase sigma factor (sigma-70 family)
MIRLWLRVLARKLWSGRYFQRKSCVARRHAACLRVEALEHRTATSTLHPIEPPLPLRAPPADVGAPVHRPTAGESADNHLTIHPQLNWGSLFGESFGSPALAHGFPPHLHHNAGLNPIAGDPGATTDETQAPVSATPLFHGAPPAPTSPIAPPQDSTTPPDADAVGGSLSTAPPAAVARHDGNHAGTDLNGMTTADVGPYCPAPTFTAAPPEAAHTQWIPATSLPNTVNGSIAAAAPGSIKELPDGTLLQRFVSSNDQAAFTALVARHEQFVLNVCQRVLDDVHAAQDAVQATFMTLARKAATLDAQRPLASWLYTIAFHLALRCRAVTVRRRRRELAAAANRPTVGDSCCAAELEQHEAHQALREELQRLPEMYRVPLQMCYFDGRTHAEVARAVGLPRGSIAKRIGAALERLRERLLARGVML